MGSKELEQIAQAIETQPDNHSVRNHRKAGAAHRNRDGAADDPGHGVSEEKDGDPHFETGASTMFAPIGNNGMGLQRQQTQDTWYF